MSINEAQDRATIAQCDLVFFLYENRVLIARGKYFEGDERKIYDYEPEKMARLVKAGHLKINHFEMYRNACEDQARVYGNLDEVRQKRYERVVKALEILAK